MGRGLKAEFQYLKRLLDPANRYIDIAVTFEVYKRGTDGPGPGGSYPTGKRSRVYGGKYDKWLAQYVGDADDSNIWVYACTPDQFRLVTSDSGRIEGNGGRGSGKSEGGTLRLLRFIAERPNEAGQVVSPTFDLTWVIWGKLLQQVPLNWLWPGRRGIRRAERRLIFQHGADIRFRSADHPDSLRSWGGGYCFIDEEQDVSNEAISIIWPSLRCSATPCLWSVGTPKAGEYRDRHDMLMKRDDALLLSFSSFTNCFVSHEAFEKAKLEMSADLYRQEIGAEWPDLDEEYVVRRQFDPDIHAKTMPFELGRDITRSFTRRRAGISRKYIAGVDYNLGPPNVCWIYRTMAGTPRIWILVDIIRATGEASYLAQAMIDKGYHGGNTLVVDDASGEFNTYKGKRGPNSSVRLMRMMGFTCLHPKKNPRIKDRVNALLAKLAPVKGPANWFYDSRLAEQVEPVMRGIKWKNEELDKDSGHDHDFDAGTYPLHYFEPPARVHGAKISGAMA